MSLNTSTRVGLLFAAVSAAWGASFLFIKVAGEGMAPVQVMVGRLTLGALVLAVIMIGTRRRWPRGIRIWSSFGLIAVFLCVIPFTLYAWAGQHLPSSLSSLYNATTPLATILVGLALLPQEKLTRGKLLGLLVAAAGVLVITAPWQGSTDGTATVLAQLACLGANLCYAIAFVLSRRLLRAGELDATTVATGQITVAAALGILLAPFLGGLAPIQVSPQIIGSMLTLGLLCTGVVYIWHATIIKERGATTGATVTYVTPVVGVVLGILILGERIQWHEPVGGALILAGLLVSSGLLGSRGTGPDQPAASSDARARR